MSQETELKLSLHPADVRRLLAHPVLAAQPSVRARLRNTYFDTPALALMQQRMAVRERRVGRRTLLTVKTAGSSVGGLSQRGEWEAPTRPGAFDFEALVDQPDLARTLTGLAWQLVPVFRTDFTRRTWLLAHAGSLIEVALDQGAITTGAAPGARSEPILELELELKHGHADALLDLAHTLALGPHGQAKQGLRLHAADRSKAERGYALFQGQGPQARKAAPLLLGADMHPVQAFRHAALAGVAHWGEHAQGAMCVANASADGTLPDPEFVHQMRVALRRLRTGLALFAPHLPHRFVAYWRAEFRALMHQLDAARNWDVLATEWLPTYLNTAAESEALQTWVAHERHTAWQAAAQVLDSPAQSLRMLAFTRALLALEVPKQASKHRALGDWAHTQLQQRYARLQREVRHALQLGPDGRHALRIQLKQLRYAQEFLSSLLPPKRVERSTAALADAQDYLGRLNDLSTAQTLLATNDQPWAMAWRAQLAQRLQTELETLPAMEHALAAAPTPWK
ncbi:CHAD domain-containing protein [Hydrogenophaga sp.]|uniref:CYTH and CHAD domain-containing protein n=1 Tax=Hydrogenophaga sp. TaxID=1904254 RepID=UPI0035648AAA